MGSIAADLWKFMVPLLPRGSSIKRNSRAGILRSPFPSSKCTTALDDGEVVPSLQQLRGEISAVGARVSYVEEQVELVKAASPALDCHIQSARLGMPRTSWSLEEMVQLQGIHWKLLQFWEELSRKQLEKLAALAECLQVVEERRAPAKSNGGVEEHSNGSEEFYKQFEQRVSLKVECDLQKKNELEEKLYMNRISSVSDNTKTTMSLVQTPPERGPQDLAWEQKFQSELMKHFASVPRCKEAPATPVLQPVKILSSLRA